VIGVSNEIAIKPQPNASSIRDSIMVALDRSWLHPLTINVAAQGGVVKLTGKVNSWYERDEAGSIAWAAPGAMLVENNIAVS